MSDVEDDFDENAADKAPGSGGVAHHVWSYVTGLLIATALTVASFCTLQTHLIWGPGVPVALVVLAVAQIGIHLTFFLHITTAPDNTNNVLALAFGVLIVALVVGGSLWIMSTLNHNMVPMDQIMQMQR